LLLYSAASGTATNRFGIIWTIPKQDRNMGIFDKQKDFERLFEPSALNSGSTEFTSV
jgi:hypothetical protein